MHRVAEDAPGRKLSLVREAIEAGMDFLVELPLYDHSTTYPFVWHPTNLWRGDSKVHELLRAAWLSLPKCAVCGAEETEESWLSVGPWEHLGHEWRELVCLACRNNPTITMFETIPF